MLILDLFDASDSTNVGIQLHDVGVLGIQVQSILKLDFECVELFLKLNFLNRVQGVLEEDEMIFWDWIFKSGRASKVISDELINSSPGLR